MAKKKTQTKKHRFKHAEAAPTGVTSSVTSAMSTQVPKQSPVTRGQVAASTRDFSYVLVDVRKILLLALGLVAFEVILWLIFSDTSVGRTVYNSVKL